MRTTGFQSIRQKQSHLLYCIYRSHFVVYFLFSILSILYGLIHKMSAIYFFPHSFSFLIFFQLFLFIMCSSTCIHHHILGHLMDSFPLIFNSDEFCQYPCCLHSFYMIKQCNHFSSNSINKLCSISSLNISCTNCSPLYLYKILDSLLGFGFCLAS